MSHDHLQRLLRSLETIANHKFVMTLVLGLQPTRLKYERGKQVGKMCIVFCTNTMHIFNINLIFKLVSMSKELVMHEITPRLLWLHP